MSDFISFIFKKGNRNDRQKRKMEDKTLMDEIRERMKMPLTKPLKLPTPMRAFYKERDSNGR